jgi:hypothetical protein
MLRTGGIAALMLVGLGPLLPVAVVQAASLVVTNLSDSGAGSLRQAITDANASAADDTITFSVSGTIVLGSTLPSIVAASTAGALTIDGSGQTITVSGNNSVQVIIVNSGADLTVKHLNIGNASGNTGGGLVNFSGTVTITDSTFSNNSASSGGGGIVNSSGTVIIADSTFSSNSSGLSSGGGIANFSGTVTITNSTFSSNGAFAGGGAIFNQALLTNLWVI